MISSVIKVILAQIKRSEDAAIEQRLVKAIGERALAKRDWAKAHAKVMESAALACIATQIPAQAEREEAGDRFREAGMVIATVTKAIEDRAIERGVAEYDLPEPKNQRTL